MNLKRMDQYVDERVHWPTKHGTHTEGRILGVNDPSLRPAGPYVINNKEVLITHHAIYADETMSVPPDGLTPNAYQ